MILLLDSALLVAALAVPAAGIASMPQLELDAEVTRMGVPSVAVFVTVNPLNVVNLPVAEAVTTPLMTVVPVTFNLVSVDCLPAADAVKIPLPLTVPDAVNVVNADAADTDTTAPVSVPLQVTASKLVVGMDSLLSAGGWPSRHPPAVVD